MKISANGANLNVEEQGNGTPALLFLHYWGGSTRTWRPVIKHLSSVHRCIAMDFRGWGESSRDSEDFGLDTLASDVLSVAAELALEDYFIVGHSMGGKVAQLVAGRLPPGLRGLILFGPAPPAPLPVPEDVRRSFVDLYATREGAETVMSNLTPHRLAEPYREQVIEDTLKGAAKAKRAWPERGMIEDIRDKAARIEVPVHIIAGSDDAVEPEDSLRKAFVGLLQPASFHVIEGAGHLAPLEAPAELAAAIGAAANDRTRFEEAS